MSPRRAADKLSSLERYFANKHEMLGDYFPEDVHKYKVDRHNFIVWIGGDEDMAAAVADQDIEEPGVEFSMANRFEANMAMLSNRDCKRPILVIMASCGGYWEEGMQMLGTILHCPNPVTVLAVKWARSMTSIIPLAADRFVIRLPAKYMYHRGTYGFYGLDQEADADDIERRKSREMMYRIYVSRLLEQGQFSKWSRTRIRNMLDQRTIEEIDVWLTAHEAVKWGFVDAVYDGNPKTLRTKAVNHLRRERLAEVLSRPIKVEIKIS